MGELRKHKRTHSTEPESFRCDHCERFFDAEWKLKAHSDSHKQYSCETCNKTFKTIDVKMKHEKILHEGLKLFCHYFNNQKTCPFASECVFYMKKLDSVNMEPGVNESIVCSSI